MTAPDPCPTEQQLAAFVDGRLTEFDPEAVEGHVDRCGRCFDLVAHLGQLAESRAPIVGEELREKVLRPRPEAPWRRRVMASVGAAAVIVMAAWWTTSLSGPDGRHTAATVDDSPATVRSATESDLVVLERPREGGTLSAGTELRWRGPADVSSYEVQVATPEGDVLWRRAVDGRRRALRLDAPLPGSQLCHVWIAAYLPDGRRITSDVVTVHTSPER